MEWKEHAIGIVAQVGAITQRRLINDYRLPAPLWSSAVDDKQLRRVESQYGTVLTLGRAGHALYPNAERLLGPAVAVDRAYQNDALGLLEKEGYRLQRRKYQRLKNGQLGSHATYAVLHLPEAEAEWRLDRWSTEFGRNRPGGEQLGLCLLYATIRNGGPGTAQIRALLKRHEQTIVEMAHPLIVAVPDLNAHRSLVREIQLQTGNPRCERGPRLRLIELPLPEIRKST